MTIRYKCEECGSVLNIKDEKAGTQGRCPKCKAEFLIPSVEAAAGASSDSSELVGAEPKKAAPAPAGSLSDDDIEQILETKEPVREREDYGVAGHDDDEDDDDDFDDEDDEYEDDDFEDDDEDDDESPFEDDAPPRGLPGRSRGMTDEDEEPPPRPRDRKVRHREATPPPPAVSSAGIAQGLMGRHEKGASLEPREEKKKVSRPFGAGGEHEGDRDEEETFSLQEKLKYFGTYVIPVVIGVGIGIIFFNWYMARWQRGDLPRLVPVTGKVTLDGVPLARAEVQFHPMASDPNKPNYKLSSSVGFTDSNGVYTLTYVANVLGAVPGRHRVQIYATDDKGQPIIPSLYNSRTTLTAHIDEKGKSEFDFDLDSSVKEGGSGKGSFNPRGK